jgi:LuxR family maltose regulon positive regulatory protein
MIAVQLGQSIADWSMMQRGLLPLAWLKQMAGESDAALALWKKAMDVVRQAESERVKAQLEAQWAQLHCVQMASNVSALVEAVTWAETYRRRNPDALSYQEVTPQMTLARVELAQGQVDKAISRLNQLEKAAAAGLQRDNLIKIRALQSLAYAAARDELTALERLSGALMLAEPEGYQRTFIDLGLPMRELLQQASRRGILPEYVARLLTGFPKSPQSDAVLPERPDPLVEPLSETESQMLRLMAAGLSNHEIADKLHLSVNTIKVYASRIYGKLGVHSRGEAAAQARALGLLG